VQLVLILGWYHWPCNIDISKYRFYLAARIDSIVISKLAATEGFLVHPPDVSMVDGEEHEAVWIFL